MANSTINIAEADSYDLQQCITIEYTLTLNCADCGRDTSYSPWGGDTISDICAENLAEYMADRAENEGWGWDEDEGPLCEDCTQKRRIQRRSLEDSLEHLDTWRMAGATIKVYGQHTAGEDGAAWLLLPFVVNVEREDGPEEVRPRLINEAAGVYETEDLDAALEVSRPLINDVVHLYTRHHLTSSRLDALEDLAVLGGLAAVGVEDLAALAVRAGSDVAERIRAAQVEAEAEDTRPTSLEAMRRGMLDQATDVHPVQ